jgi:[ribosomal protein S5]-alanine N-acetyltransferase
MPPHVALRTPDEGMAELWRQYLTRNHDRFAGVGPKQVMPSIDSAREFITGAREGLERGTGVHFFIFDRSLEEARIIGDLTFSNIVRGTFLAGYLGFRLDRAYEGRGYMSEAVSRALSYAFEDLELHRVMANYMPTNIRSARMLRRLGFSIEGYAREYLFLNGHWEDHILSSLIAPCR